MDDVTEREAVVAWLREQNDSLRQYVKRLPAKKGVTPIGMCVVHTDKIIAALERGDHLREDSNDG